MERAQYESLKLADLKDIAKIRGIKNVSSMKKAELVDALLEVEEREREQAALKEARPESSAQKVKVAGSSPERTTAKSAPAQTQDKSSGERWSEELTREAPKQEIPKQEQPKQEESELGQEHGGVVPPADRALPQPSSQQENHKAEPDRQTPPQRGSGRTRRIPGVSPASPAKSTASAPGSNGSAAGRNGGKYPERTYSGAAGGQSGRQGTDRRPVKRASAAPQPDTQQRRMPERTEHGDRAGVTERGGNDRAGAPERADRTGYQTERRDRSEHGTAVGGAQENTAATRPAAGRGGVEEEQRFPSELDSGITASGILEVMTEGYGFIRSENYLPGENDVYVAPSQIRRFSLKTGDIVVGNTRVKTEKEKFSALLYVKSINGLPPDEATKRYNFEDMTPIFPNERIRLELSRSSVSMRIMDLMSPVGKGQRGMIVSPPKAGKTTLLKQVAQSVKTNHPDMHLIILLIDERPEEVTDFREAIEGPNVEVIYSTFDELPEHHRRVAEMVIERAKRLVEHRKDVIILLDSITRLTRAYNLVIPPSGRTLSGGLDPAALHMPKRFFGAARNMREGGSLTILATALVDTGSKMDDVIYEEFKGTGNMELVLDRKLSERRLFPAIDIPRSGTRREDLLLSAEEQDAVNSMRRELNGLKPDEAVDRILDIFKRTRNNSEFVSIIRKMKFN